MILGGHGSETRSLQKILSHGKNIGPYQSLIQGLSRGLLNFCLLGSFAFALWYGFEQILDDKQLCYEKSSCAYQYDAKSIVVVMQS